MIPNEYAVHEHGKDLLREANQRRLAKEVTEQISLTQWAGKQLLKLSVMLVDDHKDECTTIEVRGQVVTVCPA